MVDPRMVDPQLADPQLADPQLVDPQLVDPQLVDPATLGGLDTAGLASAMRPLWEDAGPLAAHLTGRHVATWEDHIDTAEAVIAGMDAPTRAALLAAHPRIGSPPAALAARRTLSWEEQGGAARPDPAVTARLDELNDRYEATHGFPFVEWVAGRPRAELIGVMEHRLKRDRATELDAGCAALVAIARDRLRRLRSATP
jgi:2-oxo-4-hydroxy-4-carboxy--5-ureidoimidazoline (OHCU) decarboxylase